MGRPTEWLVSCAHSLSHAGLLPHHSSGEEKSDGSTARSFSLTVYPKDRQGTTGVGVAGIG